MYWQKVKVIRKDFEKQTLILMQMHSRWRYPMLTLKPKHWHLAIKKQMVTEKQK